MPCERKCTKRRLSLDTLLYELPKNGEPGKSTCETDRPNNNASWCSTRVIQTPSTKKDMVYLRFQKAIKYTFVRSCRLCYGRLIYWRIDAWRTMPQRIAQQSSIPSNGTWIDFVDKKSISWTGDHERGPVAPKSLAKRGYVFWQF